MYHRAIATLSLCLLVVSQTGCMTAVAAFQPENIGGETIVITKHGHPVAKLVPGGSRDGERVARAVERLRAFKGALEGVTVDELVAARREGQRF